MCYTITGSKRWGENYVHCFIFHGRGTNQTSKKNKVGTNSKTVMGFWRFSSLKWKTFQSSFQVFLGFCSIVTLTMGQRLGPEMHEALVQPRRCLEYKAGFLSRRCEYSFFASRFPCFDLRNGFWTSACLSFSSVGFKNWSIIFLEQALGILKEATWSYCIVFCHFQNTDWTFIGWGSVWELPLFFFLFILRPFSINSLLPCHSEFKS